MRTKIDIKYIQDKSKRTCTFSKRKKGAVKKVKELCSMTGSHVFFSTITESKNMYFRISKPFLKVAMRIIRDHTGKDPSELNLQISNVKDELLDILYKSNGSSTMNKSINNLSNSASALVQKEICNPEFEIESPPHSIESLIEGIDTQGFKKELFPDNKEAFCPSNENTFGQFSQNSFSKNGNSGKHDQESKCDFGKSLVNTEKNANIFHSKTEDTFDSRFSFKNSKNECQQSTSTGFSMKFGEKVPIHHNTVKQIRNYKIEEKAFLEPISVPNLKGNDMDTYKLSESDQMDLDVDFNTEDYEALDSIANNDLPLAFIKDSILELANQDMETGAMHNVDQTKILEEPQIPFMSSKESNRVFDEFLLKGLESGDVAVFNKRERKNQ